MVGSHRTRRRPLGQNLSQPAALARDQSSFTQICSRPALREFYPALDGSDGRPKCLPAHQHPGEHALAWVLLLATAEAGGRFMFGVFGSRRHREAALREARFLSLKYGARAGERINQLIQERQGDPSKVRFLKLVRWQLKNVP